MGMPSRITLTELLITVAVLAIAFFALCYAMHYQRTEARRIYCRNNLNQLAKGVATYNNEMNPAYPWPVGRAGCGTRAAPDFGGAEWLAALYWTLVIPDPQVYLCPGSPDSNQFGRALGSLGTPGGRPLPSTAVSYAAPGADSFGIYQASKLKMGRSSAAPKVPVPPDFPQNESMACDDFGIYQASKLKVNPSYAASRLPIPYDFPGNEPMACDDTEEPINHGSRDNGGMNVLFFDSHVEWWTHERVDLERGVGTGELVHLRN